jgi:streptomycin 6-kinase
VTARVGSTSDIPTPSQLAFGVLELYPVEGGPWLAELEATQQKLASMWRIELGRWLPGSRTGCARSVVMPSGALAVLKLPVVRADTAAELRVLRYWDGCGAPRVLKSDDATGALLLEYVKGCCVAEVAISRPMLLGMGEFLSRLHADNGTVRPELPTIDEKLAPLRSALARRESACAQMTRANAGLVTREEAVRRWLRDTASESDLEAVIHGDLHARNLFLMPDSGFTAIDPYGLRGDPARDVGALALSLAGPASLRERLHILSSYCAVDAARAAAHAYTLALGAIRFRRVFAAAKDTAELMNSVEELTALVAATGAVS